MATIDWENVHKVLVVRLRSIGDTVLTTPSLIELRRFLPDAQIDVLLEDWVAPVLDGFEEVDSVVTVSKSTKDRVKLAKKIRKEKYDVVFNLHGGSTATFIVRASGAKHRVGYKSYQYGFLHNHLLDSAKSFWKRDKTHSAEQQLALLGFVGVPVDDKTKTKLSVSSAATEKVNELLTSNNLATREIALIHPAAAFESKQWAVENFAKIIGFLDSKTVAPIAITSPNEKIITDKIRENTGIAFASCSNLSLPEVTALASRARIFVGNDSGIAHIASAVQTPSVVIFGSSNRDHWRPWTDAPCEVVFEKFPCQPCKGYVCEAFDEPECILGVTVGSVESAIEKVIEKTM